MAHKRQPRPDYGLGCQVEVLQTVEGVPSWLGSGPEADPSRFGSGWQEMNLANRVLSIVCPPPPNDENNPSLEADLVGDSGIDRGSMLPRCTLRTGFKRPVHFGRLINFWRRSTSSPRSDFRRGRRVDIWGSVDIGGVGAVVEAALAFRTLGAVECAVLSVEC